MRWACSDSHDRVDQVASSSCCRFESLLRTLLVLHLVEQPFDRIAPSAEGFKQVHLHVGVRAREGVRVVRLLVRHIAAAVARPEVAVPDSAALLEAEDVRARAGLGVAEADESASLADVLRAGWRRAGP